MAKLRFIALFLLLSVTVLLKAQPGDKVFDTGPHTDTLFIDAAIILPSTLQVRCADTLLRAGEDYLLLPGWHAIYLTEKFRGCRLRISYRTGDPAFFAPRKRRVISAEYSGRVAGITQPGPGAEAAGQDGGGGLSTDGVLLRGVSFGNAQDLVLNSSLNLRMAGQLGAGIGIEAALTDQEYPFQPDGTTTSVQDFDRIYVKAYARKWMVLLGDHAFNGPELATYSKFAKKNRGVQIRLNDTIRGWSAGMEADAAIARGRFSRNEFPGTEGLQGPYRLSGARGEPFIIVVSGTEVVYLDGKRMERGYQADYTIDYNLGEITFTPKRLIGQNSRIVVEFQYTDRFYSRVVGAASGFAKKRGLHMFASAYTETDLGNQPIQQDLELFDSTRGLTARQIMELAGDNPVLSQMSGARRLAVFNVSAPNYILRDSAGLKFYVHAPAPDSGRIYFDVTFTYVGAGRGRYTTSAAAANGKVYRYAGPGMGDYEPVSVLRTPNRNTLHEAGFEVSPARGNKVRITGAVSNADQNLFSKYDDRDNRGRALSVDWKQESRMGRRTDSTRRWLLKNRVNGEWTSEGFTTVERVRDVEFGRIWNRELFNPANGLNPAGNRYVLHQAEAGNKYLNIQGRWGVNRSAGISAETGLLQARLNRRGWFLGPVAELSRAASSVINRFSRVGGELGYRSDAGGFSADWTTERSLFEDPLRMHALLSQSYGFDRLQARVSKSKGRLNVQLEGERRLNFGSAGLNLTRASLLYTAGADLQIRGKKSGFMRLGGNYRHMDLLNSSFSSVFADEQHFTARMEWSFPRLLRSLGGNMFYQTLSGREQQRQFSYFEVPAGQGFFTWVDFNSNGIQEINEFQEAPFRDQARFIRLLVPTGSYINAQTAEWTGNLTWTPAKRKFSNRLSWNMNGRNTFAPSLFRYLPMLANAGENSLLAASSLIRNQAELQLLNQKWLLQLISLSRINKSMFTNGPELRRTQSHTLFQRYETGKAWQWRLTAEGRQSSLNSAFVPNLNYLYQSGFIEPSAVWQGSVRMRVTASLKFGAADSAGGGRLSSWSESQIGINRSVGKSGMLDLRASMLNFEYLGPQNTPLAFDLLQGFAPGRNIRVQADLRMTAARNVQMVISYEGRRSRDAAMIHIGRAEARYLF